MVTVEQIKAGLGDYLQTKMMPRLDSKRQFVMGMAYGLCMGRLDAVIAEAGKNQIVKAMGLIDESGRVDIDALYNAAIAQMQAQQRLQIDIPLMGAFTFDEADLRELRECIARRAQ